MKFHAKFLSCLAARSSAVLLSAATGVVVAAEWSVEPSVSLREEYNDNIHLTTSPHNSVWRTLLSPAMTLSGRSETLEVVGNARVNFNKYSGEQGLDANDRIFGLSSSWKSERNTVSLDVSDTLDSTLASELKTTGYVQARKQRRSASVSPSWNALLTERLSMNVGYSYADVKYDVAPGLTDYTYQKLSGILQYMWSEQDKVYLVASSDKVDYATTIYSTTPQLLGYYIIFPVYRYGGQDIVTGNNSKTQNVMMGIEHTFSDLLSGSLRLGRRNTHTSAVHACNGNIGVPACTYNNNSWVVDPLITFNKESRTSGSSFEATLSQKFETGQMSANASREINASGSGLVETDVFGLSVNHQFQETLAGKLELSVYRTKYLGEIVNNSNSRYASISPSLIWRLTEYWRLNTGYQYAQSKTDNVSDAAKSNMAFVELIYVWPKTSISR